MIRDPMKWLGPTQEWKELVDPLVRDASQGRQLSPQTIYNDFIVLFPMFYPSSPIGFLFVES